MAKPERRPAPEVTHLRQLPHNREAEQAILGAILRDNGAFDAARALQPDDFFMFAHRPLFAAMRHMLENGTRVDLVTIYEELKRRDEIDRVGGSDYVSSLLDVVPSSANAPHYVAIVSRLALRRRVISAHANASQLAFDDTLDQAELFAMIESELAAIQTTGQVRIRNEYQIAKELIRNATSDDAPPTLGDRAVTTPWRRVDEVLRIHPDDVVVIAGSSSSGKSILMGQWAGHVGRGEKAQNVLVASLEMSGEQMVQRQLMAAGSMFLDDVYKPRNDHETTKLFKTGDKLKGSRVEYLDRCWDLPTILREAAAMKRREGLGMLVIDYLQIIDFSREWGDRRDEQIGMATRRMKRFASEHQVPVVFASQLRRHDGREPTIEDLRESGNIGNDANTVLIVYRPGKMEGTPEFKQGDLRTIKLIVAKQRQGQADVVVELVQQFEHARFADPLEVEPQEPSQETLPLPGQTKPNPKRGAH